MHKTLQQTLKTGRVVIAVLFVMTAVEFAIALTVDGAALLTLLLVIGLAKAWLIIQYFMHFGQLWGHIADAWHGMLSDDEVGPENMGQE